MELPKGWVQVNLENLSSAISKGTTPTGGANAYMESGVGFLRVENITENGIINNESLKRIDEKTHNNELKRSILAEGDVLVSIAGTLGRTSIVKEKNLPLNTNQAIAFIRLINREINEIYVEKALSSPKIQEFLLTQAKVTAIPNLTLEIIRNTVIPLPPAAEQLRIVEKIETLFSSLDKGVEMLKLIQSQLQTYRQAVLKWAFDGEEWELRPLGELGDLGRGKSKHRPRNDPCLFADGKYPFIQTGAVKAAKGKITEYKIMYGELGLQ